MSRPKSRTRDYRLWGWIFRCNWQCQGKNPGQGIITSEVEYSGAIDNVKAKIQDKELSPQRLNIFDAIDNVKAKIQDKELSPQRLNLLMQLTMSRPKSRTRNYHLRGWIFWCNWQCQGQNPGQGIITSEVESFDAIDNVKAKIQNKGLSP
jgi:ubiquitin